MAGLSLEGGVIGDAAADLERDLEDRLVDCATLAFRVAYSVLRRREDAEDVAQEALARAYRRLPALRDRDRLRSWLVRICWRLALDHRRAGKRRERREQSAGEPASAPSAEEVAASNEFRARLWEAIDALPDRLRVVLVLAGIEGYEVREVARLLTLPEGTVKSRLHLARKKLAARLQ